jgi:hypothetical protein
MLKGMHDYVLYSIQVPAIHVHASHSHTKVWTQPYLNEYKFKFKLKTGLGALASIGYELFFDYLTT